MASDIDSRKYAFKIKSIVFLRPQNFCGFITYNVMTRCQSRRRRPKTFGLQTIT